MSSQLDLYQQVILEHNRKPRNFKEMPEASHKAEGYNPLCGDHLWIYLKVNTAGTIEQISFQGNGCAISKASASLMTTVLKGRQSSDVQELFEDFQMLLKGNLKTDTDGVQDRLGKLKIFAGIWQYPSRIKCASLAWHTMKGALDDEKVAISTEK